ncbi:MAG: transketolase, partial [Draconibacterium sp.]
GISVPTELQTTKSSISKAMAGFQKEKDTNGIDIYRCNGWDYPQLLETISRGIEKCRKEQVPALFHIDQLTQPLGHSTSGSHERYKSAERLQWEKDYDCLKRFREWIIDEKIATAAELDEISNKAMQQVKDAQKKEWKNYFSTFKTELKTLIEMISVNDNYSDETAEIVKKIKNISKLPAFTRRDYFSLAQRLYFVLQKEHSNNEIAQKLEDWVVSYKQRSKTIYSNYLYREGADSALKVKHVEAKYDGDAQSANGFEILNKNFDALFNKYPLLVTFGQDTGHLGGVNQGMKGMQAKYGKHRVFDTGIRETTIIGQGIGLAMRGFRPIAEIQYLDYLNYAHSTLSDDLATLQYRSKGRQAAPVIVRTRGHQLQGVWHAGSPMQMLLGSMKGIYLCVPRNMVQAAGMYNTLLQANDPAIVIEPLKAYSRRDKVPANLGEFTVQLGRPEILTEGDDVTLVTYGWNVTLALEAAKILLQHNIHVEVIDVQTLMPFDVHHDILKSIKKTNKVIFLDEDFIGGGSAYMLQKVVEDQQAFNYLDAAPKTVSSYDNRPAYGTDGEYFTKPNTEDIIQAVFNLLYETDREKYPKINFKNPL